jgi:hypothetical protein
MFGIIIIPMISWVKRQIYNDIAWIVHEHGALRFCLFTQGGYNDSNSLVNFFIPVKYLIIFGFQENLNFLTILRIFF